MVTQELRRRLGIHAGTAILDWSMLSWQVGPAIGPAVLKEHWQESGRVAGTRVAETPDVEILNAETLDAETGILKNALTLRRVGNQVGLALGRSLLAGDPHVTQRH